MLRYVSFFSYFLMVSLYAAGLEHDDAVQPRGASDTVIEIRSLSRNADARSDKEDDEASLRSVALQSGVVYNEDDEDHANTFRQLGREEILSSYKYRKRTSGCYHFMAAGANFFALAGAGCTIVLTGIALSKVGVYGLYLATTGGLTAGLKKLSDEFYEVALERRRQANTLAFENGGIPMFHSQKEKRDFYEERGLPVPNHVADPLRRLAEQV